MPKYIIMLSPEQTNKRVPQYGIWSTISDAPVTPLRNIVGFTHWYEREYGREGLRELPKRLERAIGKGCSSRVTNETAEDAIAHNRYGEDEERLPVEEVVEKWLRESERS